MASHVSNVSASPPHGSKEEDELEGWARFNLGVSTAVMAIFGRSVSRPSVASVPLGILGSEQGHIIVLLQLLNLRRIWKYHPAIFSTWFGRIAILFNTWSFGMLFNQMWEAFNAKNAFTEAIRQQGIAPKAGTTLGRWHFLLSLIPLFAVTQRGKPLTFTQNVRYADLSKVDPDLLQRWKQRSFVVKNLNMILARGRISEWLSLDVIRLADSDKDASKKRPVLMSIHGGAWVLGDKSFLGLSSAVRLASRGIVVVVVNYRMAPEVAFPAQIVDCKRALVYVKSHAHEWGGDSARVFVCGESAGGHLSALLGSSPNLVELQPPELKDADTSVAGSLPLYGIYDIYGHTTDHARRETRIMLSARKKFFSRLIAQTPFNEENKHLFELASPSYHIKQFADGKRDAKALGPFFLSHGTLDVLAAYDDSKVFHSELQKVRQKYGSWAPNEADVFVEVSSGVHGYGLTPSARSMALADAMADFIYHHTKRLDSQGEGMTATTVAKSQL